MPKNNENQGFKIIYSQFSENTAKCRLSKANVNISVRFIESGVDSAKGTGIDWSMNTPIFLGGVDDTTGSLWPFKLNDMTVATLNPFQFGQAWKLMQA